MRLCDSQTQLTHVRGTLANTAQLPSAGVCLALEKHLAVWRSVQVRLDLRGGLCVLPLSLQKHFLQAQGLSVLRCFARVAGRACVQAGPAAHAWLSFSSATLLHQKLCLSGVAESFGPLHDARQAAAQKPVHVSKDTLNAR